MNIREKTQEYFSTYFEGRREVLFQPIIFGQSPNKELVFDKAHEIVDFIYCEEEKKLRDSFVINLITLFNISSVLILDNKISREDFLDVAYHMVDSLPLLHEQLKTNDVNNIIMATVLNHKLSHELEAKPCNTIVKI